MVLSANMARRLRIQFPGATYHIVNRGNYRRDLFETAGAANSFERVLGAASVRFGWQIHAFAIMRNHFHLALTTPTPNLDDGMHWLQTTYAVRFNRFRSESGHLFQGRYQSPLIQDAAALLRVVDYIHLNPVVAGIVSVDRVGDFRWSSLARLMKGPSPAWLSTALWLAELGPPDSREGWARYIEHLRLVAGDPIGLKEEGLNLCRTWAIGTDAWKRTLAREHRHRSLEWDLPRDKIRELKESRWFAVLEEELTRHGREMTELKACPKQARWKVEVASALRQRSGAPYRLIAETMAMGSPLASRVAVCRLNRKSRHSEGGQPVTG